MAEPNQTKSPDDIVKYEIKNDDPRMDDFTIYNEEGHLNCEYQESYEDWDGVHWDVWEVTGRREDVEGFIQDYNLQAVATEITE